MTEPSWPAFVAMRRSGSSSARLRICGAGGLVAFELQLVERAEAR